MKTVKFHTLTAGVVGAALLTALPGAALAMDPDEAELIRYGWNPAIATSAESEAASASPYIGTSLQRAEDGTLGFTDPRPGKGDYVLGSYRGTLVKAAADGELGFDDPR